LPRPCAGANAGGWRSGLAALFAPAGTPQSVVALVNSKVNAVLSSSRVRESSAKLGIDAEGGSPDVLAARVAAEIRKWAGIVRAKNIHIEQ
jgi:tripartite-type tricarboxylate transporter receptor subunit TctC